MLAADTNILVRLLMRDDPEQFARIMAIMQHETVCATPTVVLETEWVLRSVYLLPPEGMQLALRRLLGLPELRIKAAEAVAQALSWFEQGMDFADALHLATAGDCEGLLTFDRDFIKAAARLRAGNVAEP